MARDVADTIDIGDGGAAEFHHEAAHDAAWIPWKRINRVAAPKTGSAGIETRVYIAMRPGASGFLGSPDRAGTVWRKGDFSGYLRRVTEASN
jgi:hypothetical protein